MSKYYYGKISGSNKFYVRLKEWKSVYDNMGDLQPFCRVLKLFDKPEECIRYIDWLKERDKDEKNN